MLPWLMLIQVYLFWILTLPNNAAMTHEIIELVIDVVQWSVLYILCVEMKCIHDIVQYID